MPAESISTISLAATPGSAEAKVGRAADFTWSLGVNVHIRDSTGVYGDPPSLIAALKSMGFRHVRDSVKTVPWTIARAGTRCCRNSLRCHPRAVVRGVSAAAIGFSVVDHPVPVEIVP